MGSLKKFLKKNKNLLLILVVVCFLMCLGDGGIIEGARGSSSSKVKKCESVCKWRKKYMEEKGPGTTKYKDNYMKRVTKNLSKNVTRMKPIWQKWVDKNQHGVCGQCGATRDAGRTEANKKKAAARAAAAKK